MNTIIDFQKASSAWSSAAESPAAKAEPPACNELNMSLPQ
ncbi:Uncharacterised protein [Mycobacteroides abscessus subsp. abscessus]|nr:Uncharacterised protein [Mycobacteroides abscessus subsp. abscessus]